MNTTILFFLLQFSLFGFPDEALTGASVYLEKAANSEVVSMVKIGLNGEFEFADLDPGNYYIAIDVPEHTVRQLDKKKKEKFDSDIVTAFNHEEQAYLWQRPDGFVKLNAKSTKNLAENMLPRFEIVQTFTKPEGENPGETYEHLTSSFEDQTPAGKVYVLQFTVIKQYGTFSGGLNSITQKEFHRLTIGKKEISLEDQGIVKVLRRSDN
ncbi:hypothetical protein [Roseimarinus sediminis]|jgi:hypothetical protein|uniref:hypothetical protein n=1 Tax=Roseimarinus sediminis TaxID=1610899 RepID=UPI003D257BDF